MKYKLRLAEKKDEQFIKRLHKENSKEIGSFNLFYIWDNYLKRKNKYIYHIIEDVGFVRHGYSKQKKADKSKTKLLKQINIEIYKRHDKSIWGTYK